MNNNLQTADYGYAVSAEERNRVLRNTYWLLALSMVPTVLGAVVGHYFGLLRMSPTVSLIVFFVGAYGLMFAIEKTKESVVGVVLLLVFTFFMGLMLSRLISFVLWRYSNGAELIALAFGGTGLIFFVMASLATVIKRDLSSWGKFLSVGLIMAIVIGVGNFFFFQSSPLMIALLFLVMGISTAFLLYSVKSVIDGGETNYVSATLSIYVSLYNIFQSLLSLLGIFGGDD